MAITAFGAFVAANGAVSVEIDYDNVTGAVTQLAWQNTSANDAKILVLHNGVVVAPFVLAAGTAPETKAVTGVSMVGTPGTDKSGNPITNWNLPTGWEINGQFSG